MIDQIDQYIYATEGDLKEFLIEIRKVLNGKDQQIKNLQRVRRKKNKLIEKQLQWLKNRDTIIKGLKMKPGDKVIPFGPYAFKTFNRIADSDAGLKYLDKLIGEIPSNDFKDNLKTFLELPHIKTRLDSLLD